MKMLDTRDSCPAVSKEERQSREVQHPNRPALDRRPLRIRLPRLPNPTAPRGASTPRIPFFTRRHTSHDSHPSPSLTSPSLSPRDPQKRFDVPQDSSFTLDIQPFHLGYGPSLVPDICALSPKPEACKSCIWH